MRWAVFLCSTLVGGGTYVIFEHSTRAMSMGVDVTIITVDKVNLDDLYWHPSAAALRFLTIDEAIDEEYDVVISTWWGLVREVHKIKGKQYIYFVQSIESRFADKDDKPTIRHAESTYMLPMEIITEASWIKDYLERNYLKKPILVHNGIRKDIYREEGDLIEPRIPGKLRVLVEGPIDISFKNVPRTIELCRRSKADEIWLMTSSQISEYKGVDRVFSRVAISEAAKIYRSCDVLVKLSYVEGMFGPPLEMFHCGGTAITYDVTGYDEYIVDGVNALVAHTDDEKAVINHINSIKEDPELLEKLKRGARNTAKSWIGWEESSKKFYDAVLELSEPTELDLRNKIKMFNEFFYEDYCLMRYFSDELAYLQRFKQMIIIIEKVKKICPHFVRRLIKKYMN